MKTITVSAYRAAMAWMNASLASGTNPDRTNLYRTLSLEFFPQGVQFVGCDGTILFRTWAPSTDDALMPDTDDLPHRSIVVVDMDKFALAFMRTLLAVTKEKEWEPLIIATEPAPFTETPLGEEFASEMLTLSCLGQQLHCKLYEAEFPEWRLLQFGVDDRERVEGMKIALRLFSTVGKLKGVWAVDIDFHGSNRQIGVHAFGESEMRGILMPMRRDEAEKKEKAAVDDDPDDQGVAL